MELPTPGERSSGLPGPSCKSGLDMNALENMDVHGLCWLVGGMNAHKLNMKHVKTSP